MKNSFKKALATVSIAACGALAQTIINVVPYMTRFQRGGKIMKKLTSLREGLKVGFLATAILMGACATDGNNDPSGGGLKKADDVYCMPASCFHEICNCVNNNNYTIGGLYTEKGSYPVSASESVEWRCPNETVPFPPNGHGAWESTSEVGPMTSIYLMENTAAFNSFENLCDKFGVQTKGMYIVKAGIQAVRVVVR